MLTRAADAVIRRLRCAVLAGACCPFLTVQAQQNTDPENDDPGSMDEIVVVVDRDGRPVDVDALRLEEARLKVIREFVMEQHKQGEELWRLRLRSAMKVKIARITWGYDAQTEAARFRYAQADYLPIDRVRPATFVSIRF